MSIEIIKDCIANTLNLTPEEQKTLTEHSGVNSIKGWDSTSHIDIILEIESALDIWFDDDLIGSLITINDFVKYIRKFK